MNAEQDRFGETLTSSPLDKRLAAYFASAAAVGVAMTTKAQAAIVAHTTPQEIKINGEVNIDFDDDGVAEFQIDHDRYVFPSGPNAGVALDYLQLDKNDRNSQTNPLPINALATFSSNGGTYEPPFVSDYDGNHHGSWDAGDLAAWESHYGEFMNCGPAKDHCADQDGNQDNFVNGQDFLVWQRAQEVRFSYDQSYRAPLNGWYPEALTFNTPIGPDDDYDFSETSDAGGEDGGYLRANRLIDEDRFLSGTNTGKSRIDSFLLGTPAAVEAHPDTPHFTGLGGAVRYLGVRFDLHDEGYSNNLALVNGPDISDDPNNYWYGWIGIQITSDPNATGVVTGWAYNTERGQGIDAGKTSLLPVSTAVPEPGSIIIGAFGGLALLTRFGWQRFRS